MRLAWLRRQRRPAARRSEASIAASASRIRVRALETVAVAFFIMCVFQGAKYNLFPKIGIWTSYAATIVFVTSMVGAISLFVIRKEESLRLEMASSEIRYRLLFGGSLAGAYRITLDGRILDCNVAFCQMFGCASREEVIGQSALLGYFDEADRIRFIDRLKAEKELTNFEQRLRRKDGSAVWILISAALVDDETEGCLVIQGTMSDITSRIEAQRECRLLADIVRYSHDAIFSISTEGVIQTWNAGAERIFGYSAAEIVQRSVRILIPADGAAEAAEILEKVRSGCEVKNRELVRVRKDGQQIVIHLNISPNLDAAGNVVGASSTARDITDKKHSEVALLESEEQYRFLFESNPIPMWVFDRHTLRFVSVNQAAILQYGFTEQEFLAMTVSEIRPEEDIHAALQAITGHALGLENRGLWRHRKKNGVIIDVEIVSNPLDFQGFDSMLVAAYDVTERKRSEEAVRRAEGKYRAIFEDSVVGIFQGTPDGRLTSINRAFAQMLGYDSSKEMLAENPGRASSTLVDPSRMGEWFQELSEHGVVHGVEFEIYRKDRTTKWVRGSLRAIRDASGDIVLHEGTVEDITERKQAEEMLQDSENKYRVLFEDSADATWLMDVNGFVHCNLAALHMFGYSDEALMLHPADISPAKQADGSCSRTKAGEKMAAAFLNGKERFEWLHQRKNGDVFAADVCLTALTLSGRQMLLATVRDITDRKQAEEALLFKTALLEAQSETTIDGILVVDGSDHILLANKQFGFSFGIPDELLSTRDDLIVRKYVMDQVKDPDTFVERVKFLNGNRNEKSRDEVTLKDGKVFDRYSAPLVDSKGQYRGRIWYFRDITDRKVAEERIQFLAYHDALTELPHRALLEDRLNNALANALRRHEKVALLFIDLDRLKIINDSFGHSFGDILLKDVAKRLKDCARQQDTVARVGGDEFLVLLSNIKDVADAAIAAERIMEAMKANFAIQGHSLSLGCSIGISIFPEHGVDSEALIRNADAAMYSAKESGRNNVRFFTDEMNVQAVERLTMDKDLRLALDREEFFLVYQPQMEIESGRITGLEALIRWRHPEMGLVPPDKFISIAENNGLILPIGEWVLRTACAQARSWQDEGLPVVPVAVNVSAVQFRQVGFCALIRKVLQETGLSPRYLELELTEGLLLSNEDVTLSVLRELKEMGVNLAIDDFGTGYSSLSYLRQFPVDKLKIDQSFIRDVAVSNNDAAIASAIISMAKSLHLKVIAEGVENEEQMSFLREHRCDEIQGYYLSRPISADDAALKLRFASYHGTAPLLGIASSNSRAVLAC